MRPIDLYVLVGAISEQGRGRSLRDLAARLYVDHTTVYRALGRAEKAGLYQSEQRRVHLASFEELAVHAARFIAPAPLAQLTRGIPAAWAAEPISRMIHESDGEPPPVWPSALGVVRGQALEPLHPGAVQASSDQALSALLSIIDSLRAGDVRVRDVAAKALREELRKAS